MTWGITRGQFGVCGNFRFEFHTLTDALTTRNIVRPNTISHVYSAFSTNTTDNADLLNATTLSWTGTCDSDTANEVKDTSEVFNKDLTGQIVYNTMTGDSQKGIGGVVEYKDADELYVDAQSFYGQRTNLDGTTESGSTLATEALDLCPDGNETYSITTSRLIQLTAVTGNDDGTLVVIGR